MMWKLWSDLQYHFYIVDILCMQPHNVCILQRKYSELDKIITNVVSFCGVGYPCNFHCLKQSDTSKYSKLTVFHFIFLLDKTQKKLDFVKQSMSSTFETYNKNVGKGEEQLLSEPRSRSYKHGYSYHHHVDDLYYHTLRFLFLFPAFRGFLPTWSHTNNTMHGLVSTSIFLELVS